MKKEVISYSGHSMIPPESVELLENNKGSIIIPRLDAKIVDIQDYKILSFWDRIEEIGVWKWHKKYPYSKLKYQQLLDGYSWELKLRDRRGRAKYCSGYESFPRKFKELIKALNDLFGSEIQF
jgi:hypothetical protein|tara:strand:+ start:316 stop:684 length:369 start_codon:yes stop_codon:yes gene_type:complete